MIKVIAWKYRDVTKQKSVRVLFKLLPTRITRTFWQSGRFDSDLSNFHLPSVYMQSALLFRNHVQWNLDESRSFSTGNSRYRLFIRIIIVFNCNYKCHFFAIQWTRLSDPLVFWDFQVRFRNAYKSGGRKHYISCPPNESLQWNSLKLCIIYVYYMLFWKKYKYGIV